jgi:hypothetical protein
MKPGKLAVLLALLAILGALGLQHLGLAQSVGNLRVDTPKNGENITTDFVDVRFALVNPAASAASTPNFRLQLDSESPVDTDSTEYTFTGLQPGPHTISIQLVDANGTPIPGSSATVKFKVVPQPAPRGAGLENHSFAAGPSLKATSLSDQSRAPSTADEPSQNAPPDARGALPLLSLIGFGVLAGGIVSALKTR